MLTRDALRAPFEHAQPIEPRVGIEVEVAAVDPKTGISKGYDGPDGIGAILNALHDGLGGIPILEGPHIIGLTFDDGGTITLEPGGAIEYSGPPRANASEANADVLAILKRIAGLAEPLGVAIIAAGSLPFNRLAEARWMPKSRYEVMRAHFRSLGEPARLAWRMMTQTLSVQVSLDYQGEADLALKTHVASLVSPISTALFANSPLEEGAPSGALSRRAEIWRFTDPARCGFIPPAFDRAMTIDGFIDWALDVPMLFRIRGGHYEAMDGRPFRDVFEHGFEDAPASLKDWKDHLSGIFTDIRLKSLIEVRGVDGQALDSIGAVTSFWTGLTYHQESLEAAADLLAGHSPEQHRAALAEVPALGLRAKLGDTPILELARELLSLARAGLQARIDEGLEGPDALLALAPIERIAESGVTAAEQLLEDWRGPFKQDPARLVAAARVPAE